MEVFKDGKLFAEIQVIFTCRGVGGRKALLLFGFTAAPLTDELRKSESRRSREGASGRNARRFRVLHDQSSRLDGGNTESIA